MSDLNITIYTDPEGNEYRALPEIWNNCTPLTEEYALANGWTKSQVDEGTDAYENTEFKAACEQFREVCMKIRSFIGSENFRGGFDEYKDFMESDAAFGDPIKASLLAAEWAAANEYAKYEGSKVGANQPSWWYYCWQEELKAEADKQAEEDTKKAEEEATQVANDFASKEAEETSESEETTEETK